MNFRPRRDDDDVSINLTPLIDVVFLLLIFFMVSTTFTRPREIPLQLPKASSKQAPHEALELAIDAAGRFYLGGRPVSQDRTVLIKQLRQALGNEPRSLILRADARTPHQVVVDAMDAAQAAGVSRLAIATHRRPDGS